MQGSNAIDLQNNGVPAAATIAAATPATSGAEDSLDYPNSRYDLVMTGPTTAARKKHNVRVN
jgi:hypothetical protein